MWQYKKYIIIVITLSVLNFGLILFIILPKTEQISAAKKQIAEEKKELTHLLDKGQSVTQTIKNLRQIEKETDILNNIWLHRGNELSFIKNLEKAAEEHNLTQTIKFDNTLNNNDGKISEIPLEIDLEGTLINILNYINQLERLDYYININKFSLRSSSSSLAAPNSEEQNENQNIILKASIQATTYWK